MCSLAVSAILEPFNCSDPSPVPQSISDPDVSGIGVSRPGPAYDHLALTTPQLLVAFLVTAYGAFLWMLIAYLLRWLPLELLGQADVFAFKRPASKKPIPSWWQSAINQMILNFADQQIVTGIAILSASFIKMQTLTVYHLQVVIYLG